MLNEVVARGLAQAHIPSQREPGHLITRSNKRPDGATLVPYRHGRPAIWDVVVRGSLAATYVRRTSQKAGAAAEEAEALKRRRYDEFAGDYEVVPLAFESHGGIRPATEVFLKDLGKRIRLETGDNRAGAFFKQRLSVALQRGNALCVQAAMGVAVTDSREVPSYVPII